MRDFYEPGSLGQGRPNPYVGKVKKPITLRLPEPTIDYFKGLADKSGIGYQTLINMFLDDCARRHIEPDLSWSAKTA